MDTAELELVNRLKKRPLTALEIQRLCEQFKEAFLRERFR